jgi:hypothetical protein
VEVGDFPDTFANHAGMLNIVIILQQETYKTTGGWQSLMWRHNYDVASLNGIFQFNMLFSLMQTYYAGLNNLHISVQ